AAPVHGMIRVTEGVESGVLVLRDLALADVESPAGGGSTGSDESVWSGFSGALVFRDDLAIGVVIEHRPWQGHAALRLRPVAELVRSDRAGDPQIAELAAALTLPRLEQLSLVTEHVDR